MLKNNNNNGLQIVASMYTMLEYRIIVQSDRLCSVPNNVTVEAIK